MPNDAYTQQALASDPRFLLRVKNALATAAWAVLEAAVPPPNQAARAAYARAVLADLDGFTVQIAQSLVTRPNVFAFATSYDFTQGAVVTAAGDPDLFSQLMTDWDDLAGA